MGLLGYFVFSVIRGGEAHCFSPLDSLRKPLLWLELISETRATIAAAQNAADFDAPRGQAERCRPARGPLGSLRQMVKAAEPVRAETFEQFYRRFSRFGLRKSAYVAGYGLAEHTLCVSTGGRRRITDEHENRAESGSPKRLVSCGTPAAGVDVRIVDPNSLRPVVEGQLGEIWVDSPSKAAGYWRQPSLSALHFGARLKGEHGSRRYLRTGDLGFMRDGELYVCGRRRDMLVLKGRNLFPSDIEATLETRFSNLWPDGSLPLGRRFHLQRQNNSLCWLKPHQTPSSCGSSAASCSKALGRW